MRHHTAFLIVCVAFAAFSGCCPCRHLQTSTTSSDSVRVEVRDSIVERIDTTYITLPAEAVRNVTRDTFSRVETAYAISTARIDTSGFLWHDISTKPTPVQVLTKTITEHKDSIIYRDKVREVRDVVQVKSPPTKWQKFQQRGFWVLVSVGVLMAVAAVARRYYRV